MARGRANLSVRNVPHGHTAGYLALIGRGRDDGQMQEEQQRIAEADRRQAPWRRGGPYLSERAWGTVRED